MATVAPDFNLSTATIRVAKWAALATGDTITSISPARDLTLAGTVQISGTFGGATVVLQASNDGTNWVTLDDAHGAAITTTALAMFEISTSALYLRPGISGGTADAVDVTLAMRG